MERISKNKFIINNEINNKINNFINDVKNKGDNLIILLEEVNKKMNQNELISKRDLVEKSILRNLIFKNKNEYILFFIILFIFNIK